MFDRLITAQKMKFFIKDFSSKSGQIRSFLRIWSHLLEKSLMKNFTFCAVDFLLVAFAVVHGIMPVGVKLSVFSVLFSDVI